MIDLKTIINNIKKSDIGYRIANGAFWSFTGTAVAKLFVLVATIVCAHILTKQEYGEFGMVRSTIYMFVVLGSAGLGLTATKFISEYRDNHKERIVSIYLLTNGFAIVTGLLVTIIVLIFAPYLAESTLHAPHLVQPIRVGAILLLITVLNGAQNGTLSGFEDFKSIAINTFWGSVAESILMILGAYYGGVIGAVLGYGVSFIVLYVANNISIKNNFRKIGLKVKMSQFKKEDLQLLYRFSLPAALSSILVTPTIWIAKTILTRNSGFEELAVYEAADQWRVLILFIPMAVSQVALPILSNVLGVDKSKFWKVLKINLSLNILVALIMAIAVSILSPSIMHLYGKGYVSDYMVIVILACSTVFSSAANVIGLAISSRSKMWTGFLFNLFWAILVITFALYFISKGMGAKGLALSYTVGYAVHAIIQMLYLRIISKENKE